MLPEIIPPAKFSFLIHEAARCLQCWNAPCESACPVHIPVPRFIAMLKSGNFLGAAEEIKAANTLANICGTVCPQEVFCQAACTRGKIGSPVAIRELHDLATAAEAASGFRQPVFAPIVKGCSVAIVGAGPAGLSCALELLRCGIPPVLYDVSSRAGGVPAHVIPEWRIHQEAIDRDLNFLERFLPVPRQIRSPVSLRKLLSVHSAVFLATGLWRDRRLGIPGEDLKGVFYAMDYLRAARTAPEKISGFRKVIVVGGGNVSLDVAATARRLGAEEVMLTYRRSPLEMRTWKAEREAAEAAGVLMAYQTQPVEILGSSGGVRALKLQRTRMMEQVDDSGRRIAGPVSGSEFVLETEAVVVAVGQESAVEFDLPLERGPKGTVRTGAGFATSIPGVFAGGDLIRGEGTIVEAVADGKRAAKSIAAWLSGQSDRVRPETNH